MAAVGVEVEVAVVAAEGACWTIVTEVIGYSWLEPLTISCGSDPEATCDVSIPVTMPVSGEPPFVPGRETSAPRNEFAAARDWVCEIWLVCWSVVNCASWVIVCVGSIGCSGS